MRILQFFKRRSVVAPSDPPKVPPDEARKYGEEYFRLVTDNASDMIVIVDAKGMIKYANKVIERYLGYSPAEMIGRSGFRFIFRDDIPRAINDFRKSTQIDRIRILNSFRMRHKNGSMRFFEGTGTNLLSNPIVAGFVMNIRDVTEEKEMGKALRESEDRNRMITENTSDLIAVTTFEMIPKYLYLSPSHEKAMGYKIEELIGKAGLDYVHPEDRMKLASMLNAYLAEKARKLMGFSSKPWHETFDYRVRTKDGSWVYLESTADLVGDKIVMVSRNITERKKMQEELIKAKEFSDIVMNSMPGIFFVFDTDGKLLLWNKKVEEISGYSHEEIKELTNFDVLFDEEKIELKDKIEEAFTKGEAHMEGYLLTKNKKSIPFYLAGRRVAIDNVPYLVGTGTDISESKKSEAALIKAYTELKDSQEQFAQVDKLDAIGRLAGGVAHEVKNPLGIILQGVNFLEDKVSAGHKDMADIILMIKNNIEKADNIIRALLDFSRTGKLDLNAESLNAILEDALVLLKYPLVSNKITVVKDLKSGLPAARVDRRRVEQVFMNVFLNGIQSMPTGGRLSIRSYLGKPGEAAGGVMRVGNSVFGPEERALFVEVEDTGAGIPDENLSKIFEPFFTTKAPGEGAGLGLSVAHNIIDMHRGFIDVESRVGKGTKVTVVLGISIKEGKSNG
ncbi:MAG: PAS domain S-box protein [Candidatus Omnitrophica bacterium]|nr:PAS domain S-box protein [Candidatus Omnitrophota bacterium]